MASYVGNNTIVLFDVLQIQAKEVEDEETTNKLLRDLDKELGEEVKKLEDKVDMLKNRILDVPGSQEFLKLEQEIKKFRKKSKILLEELWG